MSEFIWSLPMSHWSNLEQWAFGVVLGIGIVFAALLLSLIILEWFDAY